MSILIILGIAVISNLILKIILKIIDKFDNKKIYYSKKIGVISLIITSIFYIKFGITKEFFIVGLFLNYLLVIAFIDYKTKTVYSVFNYVVFIILLLLGIMNISNIEIKNIFILIAFSITVLILGRLKFFGLGDSEIYILITSFFIILAKNDVLTMLLIDMLLANIFMILFNLSNINLKILKLKEEVPFIPYIFLSTTILCLL